jgi:hypothetical protein
VHRTRPRQTSHLSGCALPVGAPSRPCPRSRPEQSPSSLLGKSATVVVQGVDADSGGTLRPTKSMGEALCQSSLGCDHPRERLGVSELLGVTMPPRPTTGKSAKDLLRLRRHQREADLLSWREGRQWLAPTRRCLHRRRRPGRRRRCCCCCSPFLVDGTDGRRHHRSRRTSLGLGRRASESDERSTQRRRDDDGSRQSHQTHWVSSSASDKQTTRLQRQE